MPIFEDILLISSSTDPTILWKYSAAINRESSALPRDLARICCPNVGATSSCSEFTFTITDGKSRRVHGLCRRLVGSNAVAYTKKEEKLLCILSPFPLYVLFSEILRVLQARLLLGSRENLLSFIKKLDSLDINPYNVGQSFVIEDSFHHFQSKYQFSLSLPGDLVFLEQEQDKYAFKRFLYAMENSSALITVIGLLLSEQRVILVSKNIDILYSACYVLLLSIQPFIWKHMNIPCLPKELINYCCAPVPFLFGLPYDILPQVKSLPLKQVVFVDIDHATLEFVSYNDAIPTLCSSLPVVSKSTTTTIAFSSLHGCGKEAMLERDALGTLNRDIHSIYVEGKKKQIKDFDMGGILASLLTFFVHLFGNDNHFLQANTVKKEYFLQLVQNLHTPLLMGFLRHFLQGSLFDVYSKERLGYRNVNWKSIPCSVFYTALFHLNGSFLSTNISKAVQRAFQLPRGYHSELHYTILSITSVTNLEEDEHFQHRDRITLASFNLTLCPTIMGALWGRLKDCRGRNWRQGFKSLQICEHLIEHGSEVIFTYLLDNTSQLFQLEDYLEKDGGKEGSNKIREKAQHLRGLLNKPELLQAKRRAKLGIQHFTIPKFPKSTIYSFKQLHSILQNELGQSGNPQIMQIPTNKEPTLIEY